LQLNASIKIELGYLDKLYIFLSYWKFVVTTQREFYVKLSICYGLDNNIKIFFYFLCSIHIKIMINEQDIVTEDFVYMLIDLSRSKM
jgi:hypothetical protein